MKSPIGRGSVVPLSGCALIVCLASCVNQVGNESSGGSSPGDIPISFTSTITQAETKVTDNAFESGDKAGLFAVISPGTLDEERYIDNLCLNCGTEGMLYPEKEVFYPAETDARLDFYSYYPYRQDGMQAGSRTMDISIIDDQSDDDNYAGCDFLLACTTGIAAGTEPVALTFGHQLAKINFTLLPQAGMEAAGIVAADPAIVVGSIKTTASLDLHTGSFTCGEQTADIIPHGDWTEDGEGHVSGKACIVIPQALEAGLEVTVEWNGKLYACPLTLDRIESDTEITVHIEVVPTEDDTLTGMVADIKAWGNTQTLDTESRNRLNRVSVSALSFTQSNVYHVFHLGRTVAEVCKEYLYDETAGLPIDAQAIVLYPVTGEQTDLTRGTVLQLLGVEGAVHGGTVCWNTDGNTFTYTPGCSLPISCFYIDADGTPTLTKPDEPLPVTVSCYLLRDTRDTLQTYPIVKVATQYWMRDDLHATLYNDGEEITKRDSLNEGAGYFQREDDLQNILYNGEALLTGKMAPQGWRVPTESDWTLLKAYVHEEASKLKGGTWEPLENEEFFPYDNLSGLTIHPTGMLSPTQGFVNHTRSAVYWTSGTDGEPVGQHSVYLHCANNDIAFQSVKVDDIYIGAALRCIKE
ncbi:MAG: fimbrillin family protein [Prevotellaceae bacterium]|nr:fimbrillin family protein [Prevotellaceae bacterium]